LISFLFFFDNELHILWLKTYTVEERKKVALILNLTNRRSMYKLATQKSLTDQNTLYIQGP
jgi:hypothetical protein